MQSLFNNYSSLIVFLHVISAVLWVGGMIAIRFAIHYSIQDIKEPKIKLERTLENLRRFFNMVIPAIITILITAIIMIIALNLKQSSLYSTAIAKESIWTIMTIVFITIYIKRNKAQKYFNANDLQNCKNQLAPIAKFYIPLNIILGIIAIYLGVVLRGF
ncbi:hypothetical protein [Arcobacter sp. CECT 8985]|uniref:hypothetical protein n=1 Tax=Arcobacter sp. CECT 8985 TaxID=1935424 RepID=UPI00100B4C17|nr:hypothetical protein [Arcobacter sp. CECT 8985]RXJ85226.1 hypothetical protein CRU93_11665 [Arcobacter sp. CECT 8985]